MGTTSESADEVVKLALEGFEVVAKLSGNMAKNLAVMLYTMSKDTSKRTKGKTRLSNMLKSNSNLTIFSIKKEDYPDFKKQAKKYGVLYCALFNKNEKTSDGLVDLLIREEDAVRVNRVVERYNITKVDIEKVEKTLDGENKTTEKNVADKNAQKGNTPQELLNKLKKKTVTREVNENTKPSNMGRTEKGTQSENLLKENKKTEETKPKVETNITKVANEKTSIREKLENAKRMVKEKEDKAKAEIAVETNPSVKTKETINHIQPKKLKEKNKGR